MSENAKIGKKVRSDRVKEKKDWHIIITDRGDDDKAVSWTPELVKMFKEDHLIVKEGGDDHEQGEHYHMLVRKVTRDTAIKRLVKVFRSNKCAFVPWVEDPQEDYLYKQLEVKDGKFTNPENIISNTMHFGETPMMLWERRIKFEKDKRQNAKLKGKEFKDKVLALSQHSLNVRDVYDNLIRVCKETKRLVPNDILCQSYIEYVAVQKGWNTVIDNKFDRIESRMTPFEVKYRTCF